ncbi:hypothetical protein LQG66_09610 [Bradyrhizobium ontarionense]|uniref:Peptidoglycan-binding protein n=1 Tax=Bradyrhizobium ontarionense TaxID=2898149 RepID=A0ABY3RHX7_9BRAD|nr:hypothetical protein [Bradyrhizobium sp. A19]UFZ06525.1 hypothetical protein LQG66_09610 [Bradyrhizobium sp. A19]
MTWKEERDALIAQTMAFVQSVTGKPADFAQFALPVVPVATPVAPQQAVTGRGVSDAAERASAAHADPAGQRVQPQASELQGTAVRPDSARAGSHQPGLSMPGPARAAPVAPERFTSIASQLDLQRDMQAEIRSRVARFRAHQERFNRERQEYFSAELARLKASGTGLAAPEE